MIIRLIYLFIISLSLFACGGGNKGTDNSFQGVFIDSLVQGLVYETDSFTGETDEFGVFHYQLNENIRFYLGEQFLGESTAKAVMTPRDLVTSDAQLSNLITLLQSLDLNNNTKDGIQLPDNLSELIPVSGIEFSLPTHEFQNNKDVLSLLAKLGKSSGLIDEDKAAFHFLRSLQQFDSESLSDTALYTIGGAILGLKGNLSLSLYDEEVINVSRQNQFIFPSRVLNGTAYDISIATQPEGQTCRILGGKGIVQSGDVSSISLICEDNNNQLSGLISGLDVGTLILQASNYQIFLSQNGDFSISESDIESLKIIQQPDRQTCSLEISGSLLINCISNANKIGGVVQSLSGELVLKEISSNNLLRISTNGEFSFENAFPENYSYRVEIIDHPLGQTCTIENAAGTIQEGDINNIAIDCSKNKYNLIVEVSGNRNDIDIIINEHLLPTNDTNQFVIPLYYQDYYKIRIGAVSDEQTCKLNNGALIGQMPSNDLTLHVLCSDKDHYFEISTSNFLSNYTLVKNGSIVINIDKPIVSIGSSRDEIYEFQVQHPVGQLCSIANGSGKVSSIITPISISCVTQTYEVSIDTSIVKSPILIKDTVSGISLSSADVPIVFNLLHGMSFNLEIENQPESQKCSLINSSDVISGRNYDVTLICKDLYMVNGNVTGLIDVNLSGPFLSISATTEGGAVEPFNISTLDNTTFTFPNAVLEGESINLQIINQPFEHVCKFTNGSQIILFDQASSNINTDIQCEPNKYQVGGSISSGKLTGQLKLGYSIDVSEEKPIDIIYPNTVYAIGEKVPYKSSYNIKIIEQAENEFCEFESAYQENYSDTLASPGDVRNINIRCINMYSIPTILTMPEGLNAEVVINLDRVARTGGVSKIYKTESNSYNQTTNTNDVVPGIKVLVGEKYSLSIGASTSNLLDCHISNSIGEIQEGGVSPGNEPTIVCINPPELIKDTPEFRTIFEDSNLAQCILDHVEPIWINEEFTKVTELNCSNKNITSIKGIEKFTNLSQVNLSENDIRDFQALRDLTKLNDNTADNALDISNNTYPQLSSLNKQLNVKDYDVDPILLSCIKDPINTNGNVRLDQVQFLNCSNWGLTSLSGIEMFSNLVTLNLNSNKLTDITSLYKLNILDNKLPAKLEELILSNNEIDSIGDATLGLLKFKSLKILELRNNQFTNASMLSDTSDSGEYMLKELNYLNLENIHGDDAELATKLKFPNNDVFTSQLSYYSDSRQARPRLENNPIDGEDKIIELVSANTELIVSSQNLSAVEVFEFTVPQNLLVSRNMRLTFELYQIWMYRYYITLITPTGTRLTIRENQGYDTNNDFNEDSVDLLSVEGFQKAIGQANFADLNIPWILEVSARNVTDGAFVRPVSGKIRNMHLEFTR